VAGVTDAVYNPDGNIIQRHPTEAAMPLATALAALIAAAIGVEDTDTILYLALVLSFIPAAVTWLVTTFRKPKESPAAPVGG
jgi:hypothetical protein